MAHDDREEVITCRALDCGYVRDRPTLKGVELSITRSEIFAILGGSGSGKSTLLRTLGGLLPPLSGEAKLFERNLYTEGTTGRAEILRRTGMLFQRDALFGSLTVLENVMLPLRELTDVPDRVAREMARAKLALVDVAELALRLPAEISGGQRKRVALARAMIRDPEILFCDEPTSGLDPVTAALVDELLLRIAELSGVTVVAVTHDVDSLRAIAQRALVVAGGGIRAVGTVAELEENDDPDVRGFFHRTNKIREIGRNHAVESR